MKRMIIAGAALLGMTLMAVPSANAGTHVSIGIGLGYQNPPVYYQPAPYYRQPVYYQPVYRPVYRPAYYYGGYNRGYYNHGYNNGYYRR